MSIIFTLAFYGGVLFSIWWIFHNRNRWAKPGSANKTASQVAKFGALVTVPIMVIFILQIRSSTAGFWIIAIPVYSLGVWLICFALTWATIKIMAFQLARKENIPGPSPLHIGGSLLIFAVALLLFGNFAHSEYLSFIARTVSAEQAREIYAGQSERRNHHVLVALARNKNCPPDVLLAMAKDQHPSMLIKSNSFRSVIKDDASAVIRYVAQHMNLPAEARDFIASNGPDSAAAMIAGDPTTPLETLRLLGREPSQMVAWRLASNGNTPAEILNSLSTHKSEYTRRYVAGNPNTPTETVARLASDRFHIVREAVALNTGTPLDALRKLANDPNDTVRFYLATNDATPEDVLRILAVDKDARAVHAANKQLNHLERSRKE